MLRDRRWKYVYNATAEDEMYDLETDPGELRNVVDEPANADRLQAMRERMSDIMREIGDPLSTPTFLWQKPIEPVRRDA
ncbi:MAG: hypothetical protein AAGK78_15955, partial [Planctomycetota bacterium]